MFESASSLPSEKLDLSKSKFLKTSKKSNFSNTAICKYFKNLQDDIGRWTMPVYEHIRVAHRIWVVGNDSGFVWVGGKANHKVPFFANAPISGLEFIWRIFHDHFRRYLCCQHRYYKHHCAHHHHHHRSHRHHSNCHHHQLRPCGSQHGLIHTCGMVQHPILQYCSGTARLLPMNGCAAHSTVPCPSNTWGALGKPSMHPPLRNIW